MFYGSLSEPGFSSQKTLNFPTFSHILSPASSKSPHPRHHSLFILIDQIWIEYMHVSLNRGQRSGKQAEGDSSPAGMPPLKAHLQKHLQKHLGRRMLFSSFLESLGLEIKQPMSFTDVHV